MKRAATIFISAVITLSLGVTVFAQGFDISAGDVTINQDGNYEITGTSSEHKIIVLGANAVITLHNVNITTNDTSAIDIDDNSDVQLIISGTNTLTVTNEDDEAGIHISGGSLTISGTDSDDDVLTVLNTDSQGATIGSNEYENFTGTITIDGGVTVNAGYYDINDYYYTNGAGIGSGYGGDMNGTIMINEDSVVYANAVEEGAGIGSGSDSELNGTIIINGGEVHAFSGWDGAGIGSGEESSMNGEIIISDGIIYADSYDSGAGIGTGESADMHGTVTINGGTIYAVGEYEGAGIGSGCEGDMAGEIIINGGRIDASSYSGIDIGSGYYGYVSGGITIHGNAVISLNGNNQIGAYNESTGTIYLYKGAEINGITVENIEDIKEAGILNDNMSVELLEEPKTDSGHSYSLNKSNSVSKIKAAKAGDTVYVYESQLSKGKVPYYVLEELAKTDGVTLVVVSDSGETVEIKSSNIPEKGKNAFFTVDELLEMYGK